MAESAAQAPFEVEPLDASFGATVTGLTLASLDDPTFDALYATWLDYGLLVFPGQFLTNDEQVQFTQRFGELEFPLSCITNVDKDGKTHSDPAEDWVKSITGNQGWHCDSTYMPVLAKGAVFTAHTVPTSGGATGWADMRAAYDALDAATQDRIHELKAYHSLWYSQSKLGHKPKVGASYGFHELDPPLRPLVKVHPETGRKSLVIGRHAYGIPGLSETESAALLDELVTFACQAPRVYHHDWAAGDAVVWDNRRLLHQATPWDMREPRVMYHARIAGDPATEFAAHE